MTTKFGVEIEFIGLGRDLNVIVEKLNDTMAANPELAQFNVRTVGYTHKAHSFWKVVPDASVSHGAELVSPPLPMTKESLDLVKSVCKILELAGASANNSCGLHVHFDSSFADALDGAGQMRWFETVVAAYQKAEPTFDKLTAIRRKNGQFCKSLIGKHSVDIIHDRYHKVNLLNAYSRHKTIEFRQLQGTINGDAIVAWINVTRRFTENTWKFFQVLETKRAV